MKPARNRRKVLIVDDQPIVRVGLTQLIESESDLAVCGEAGTGAQALNSAAARRPDLVITEIILPDRGGLDLIKDLLVFQPGLPILVFSMHDEAVYVDRVLRGGGRGYLMKREPAKQVIQAIRHILDGNVYVSDRMSDRILQIFSGRPPAPSSAVETLSPREFEIFEQIGGGRGTRDIAERLHISVKTVEVHRANIKRKLGLKGTAELVRAAVRWFELGQPGRD